MTKSISVSLDLNIDFDWVINFLVLFFLLFYKFSIFSILFSFYPFYYTFPRKKGNFITFSSVWLFCRQQEIYSLILYSRTHNGYEFSQLLSFYQEPNYSWESLFLQLHISFSFLRSQIFYCGKQFSPLTKSQKIYKASYMQVNCDFFGRNFEGPS